VRDETRRTPILHTKEQLPMNLARDRVESFWWIPLERLGC